MLIPFDSHHPQVDPRAWVAPTATLVGRVDVAELASIWFGVVIRADQDAISVGPRSNIQDNAVLHTDVGLHLRVGAGVVVGHAAVLHGCRIEDDVLVGMGAIVLNGARIGAGSIVGAGALVSGGMDVPPRSLVLGSPAKVRREVSRDEMTHIRNNAGSYLTLMTRHATPLTENPPPLPPAPDA